MAEQGRINGRRRAIFRAGNVALLAVVLLTVGWAGRASAAIPSGNLLQNPGAEAVPQGSTASCSRYESSALSIPSWTTTNGLTAMCYATGDSQPSATSAAVDGANSYFLGGNQATSSATQTVDVSGAATQIDAAGVDATLSGFLGGAGSENDTMTVTAAFLSATSQTLGSPVTIGPVTAAELSNQSGMLFESSGPTLVPLGTRTIQVTLSATRTTGIENDAAADNLSLSLTDANNPPPTNTAVPTVPSSAIQGTRLTATNGSWSPSPTSYSYQWVRCDDNGWSNCNNISGATAQSYTPTSNDAGKALRVSVIATGTGGSSLAAVSLPTDPVTPLVAIPSANLLVNGDAEQGQCSTAPGTVPVPHWTTTLSFTDECYAASSTPDPSGAGPNGGGNGLFYGGSDQTTTAAQTVDVSPAAPRIDQGTVQANLDGYLAGYAGQGDNITVTATFLDGTQTNSLGSIQIGPVSSADAGNQTAYVHRSAAQTVPVNTRYIQVTLTSERTDGSFNDGSADNLSLTLSSVPTHQLTVTTSGTGGGSVTSSPAQISCPGTCSGLFTSGSQVTLTAHPDANSVLQGWSGGGCSGSGTCTVTMGGDQAVTADFEPEPPTGPRVSITLSGARGYDRVTSNPAGINCGAGASVCSATFAPGSQVSLNASDDPANGSVFVGWVGGGCAGINVCSEPLKGDVSLTAQFGDIPAPLRGTTAIGPLFWGPETSLYDYGYAVSCPSYTLCLSAGEQPGSGLSGTGAIDVATNTAQARNWQGARVNGSGVILSISCASTSFCAAGDDSGNILTSTNPAAGGSSFSVAHVDGNREILGISCVTGQGCAAVDDLGNVLVSANPGGGSSAWTSRPIGSNGSDVNGISCTSSACVAVDNAGQVLVTSNAFPFGTAPVLARPFVATTIDSGNAIGHISCAQNLCAATDNAGNVFTSTNPGGGAAAWHGAHISTRPLRGVSCATSSFCATGNDNGGMYVSANPTGPASAWSSGGNVFMHDISCTQVLLHGLGVDMYCVTVARDAESYAGTYPVFSISRLGTGHGAVSAGPDNFTCPSTCQHLERAGTSETLSAIPAAGYAFSGWKGACTGSGLTCTITINASEGVAAIFSAAPVGTLGGVAVSGGTATTTLRCSSAKPCTGTVVLTTSRAGIARAKSREPTLVGKATFRIKAHKRGRVRIRLTATGKKLAKQHKLHSVLLTITTRQGGHRLISLRTVRVR